MTEAAIGVSDLAPLQWDLAAVAAECLGEAPTSVLGDREATNRAPWESVEVLARDLGSRQDGIAEAARSILSFWMLLCRAVSADGFKRLDSDGRAGAFLARELASSTARHSHRLCPLGPDLAAKVTPLGVLGAAPRASFILDGSQVFMGADRLFLVANRSHLSEDAENATRVLMRATDPLRRIAPEQADFPMLYQGRRLKAAFQRASSPDGRPMVTWAWQAVPAG